MCPMKLPGNNDEALWSNRLESVRKDVECLFGMLRAFQNSEDSDAV